MELRQFTVAEIVIIVRWFLVL